MNALLKKDNVINIKHIIYGYIIMFIGGIISFICFNINDYIYKFGNMMMVYGCFGWVIFEVLIGEKEE